MNKCILPKIKHPMRYIPVAPILREAGADLNGMESANSGCGFGKAMNLII